METQDLIIDVGSSANKNDQVLLVDETGSTTADFRATYIDQLAGQPNETTRSKIQKIKNTPVTYPISEYNEVYGDSEPSLLALNLTLSDAVFDILTLDNYVKNLTSKYSNFIHRSLSNIKLINEKIMSEKQRLEDINMICSSYKELNNVIQINKNNVSGKYGYLESSNMFMMYGEKVSIDTEVYSIEGNGYEGNEYAYSLSSDGKWIRDDRTARANITDESSITIYEYSRLISTSQASERKQVNNDSEDVKITLRLKTKAYANALLINPSHSGIIIKKICLLDNEGNEDNNYLKYPISLDSSCVYSSSNTNMCNYINLPQSKYMKLELESGYVDESEYIIFEDEDKAKYTSVDKNVKRKNIGIRNIEACSQKYESSSFQTIELLKPLKKTEISSIAVFANEYYPNFAGANFEIKYYLIINGAEYEVVPINSNKVGIKLLSYTNFKYTNSSVSYLSEAIKTAYLKVTINSDIEYATPQIYNLKICTG